MLCYGYLPSPAGRPGLVGRGRPAGLHQPHHPFARLEDLRTFTAPAAEDEQALKPDLILMTSDAGDFQSAVEENATRRARPEVAPRIENPHGGFVDDVGILTQLPGLAHPTTVPTTVRARLPNTCFTRIRRCCPRARRVDL